MMIVKLPKKCSGQEIVEAFSRASGFQESPTSKWESRAFIDEFQYEPGSVKRTIRSKGVQVRQYALLKKWGLWGKKVWKKVSGLKFTLNPLQLSKEYDEVNVDVKYVYDVDQLEVYVATDPRSSQFEEIRPGFEKILNRFFMHLQP